MFKITHTPRNI